MPQVNPLITTPEEQFVVGESDFAFFGNYACRVEEGAILFCRSGSADATVNQYQGQVRRNTMVLLLPGGFQGGLLLVFAGSLFRGGLPDGPFVFPRPA